MYLTYTEYKALGGQLGETSFNMHAFASQQTIDTATMGRLVDQPSVLDAVKYCMFQLIAIEQRAGSVINSESVGNWSIVYKDPTEIQNAKNSVLFAYLGNVEVDGVPVLYRGVK